MLLGLARRPAGSLKTSPGSPSVASLIAAACPASPPRLFFQFTGINAPSSNASGPPPGPSAPAASASSISLAFSWIVDVKRHTPRSPIPLVVVGVNSIAAYLMAHLFEDFVEKQLPHQPRSSASSISSAPPSSLAFLGLLHPRRLLAHPPLDVSQSKRLSSASESGPREAHFRAIINSPAPLLQGCRATRMDTYAPESEEIRSDQPTCRRGVP